MVRRLITTDCKDWSRRLKAGALPINPRRLPMTTPDAERFSSVFRRLIVPDIAGKPEVGTLSTFDWLDQAGRALYGSPTIRELFVLIPKKQNKTSGGALMLLAALMLNRTPGHQFSVLAPTTGIADFAFSQLAGSIEADSELQARFRIRRHVREIDDLRNGAELSVKPASLAAVTGLKGSVFVDELHVWGKMRDGQKLRQQLKGALMATPTAKGIYLTTQSDDEPTGVFRNMLAYARAVRAGKIEDPAFLPMLVEPWAKADPWTDESLWPKLLPAFPHIAGADFYRATIAEAEQSGPSAVAEAKSQFFNIEIGAGEAAQGWEIARAVPSLMQAMSLEELLEQSDRVSIGIDLGGAWDLSALAVLGVTPAGAWLVWCRAWLTEAGLKRNVRNRARFTQFADAGDLEIIPPGGDVEAILQICDTVRETGKLVGAGIDPASAADLADALEVSGFIMDQDLFGIGQTSFKLAPAVRSLERRVDRRAITFADQPLVTWAIGNVTVPMKGNAPAVSKEKALDKVDPVFAILDAITVEIAHRPEEIDIESLVA